MKKYFILIFVIFLFACSALTVWTLVDESKLIKAEYVKGSWSGFANAHWLMTFENGVVLRNWDKGYWIGKIYKIYYSEKGQYKAVLKEPGGGLNE